MLTSGQIQGMRGHFNRLLPDTATIRRRSIANVGGEQVETWNTLATVPCRITFIGGGEAGNVGGKIEEETTHLVTVAAETDVEEIDRIVIDGTTYTVTLVRKRGEWELSRRIEVKEEVD